MSPTNVLTAQQTAQIALLGMTIVFFVLVMLFLLIVILRRVMNFARKDIASDTALPVSDLAPKFLRRRASDIARGEMKINFIDSQTAALLLAIAANETEIPIDRLIIKSIVKTQTQTQLPVKPGEKYAFEIKKGSGGQMKYLITLNENAYTVEVSENTAMLADGAQARDASAQKKPEQAAAGGSGAICAPLPGVCVKINVKPGDTVKEGDIIAIIEAMKMENEVPATKSGKVAGIAVKAGDAVNTGDELIRVE